MRNADFSSPSIPVLNPNTVSSQHLAYLDSVRGLAALTVLNEHFVIAYGFPCESKQCMYWLDYSPLHFWWDGTAAVSMFFVLSGLVLSLKYFRSGLAPDTAQLNLMGFTLNRFIRIWFPYMVTLIVSALLYHWLVNTPALVTALPASDWMTTMWRGHELSMQVFLKEAFLPLLPDNIILIPQAWTLRIELVLSLLLPVGMLLIQRSNVWLIFFSVFMVSFLGMPIFLMHFLLGLFLAKYYQQISKYINQAYGRRLAMLCVGLLFYTAAGNPFSFFNETGLWLLTGLGAGMVLMFIMSSTQAQRWLAQPGLRQLGQVSYSVYLLHMLILMCLTPFVIKGLQPFIHNHLALWLAAWMITVAVSLSVALLSFYAIERPCIEQGKRLSRLLNNI